MTRLWARVYDRLVESLFGIALALLIAGIGLWIEAASPSLPGARPLPDVYSVVSHLGYSAPVKNHVVLQHLEALAAADPELQFLGALPRARIVILPDQKVETRFDLVIGPFFQSLGVALHGRDFSTAATSLPLSPEPIREVVLSHAAALRWFGSAQAALGKTLTVATMEWNLNGRNPAEFEIIGVAAPAFSGTNIERPAEFWIGINGWHDVVFPKHQMGDFRRHFPPSSLMLRSAQAQRSASRMQEALRELGEPHATIALVPGTGYHPQRRARFRAIAQGLVLGLATLAAMLALSVAAHALLSVERGRHSDTIRSALGESRLRHGLRQAAAGMRSFVVVLIAAGVVLAAAPALSEYGGLPIAAAVERGLTQPGVIAAAVILLGVFALQRSLLGAAISGWQTELRLGALLAGFFGLAATGLLLSWLVGGVAVTRLTAALHIQIPTTASAAWVLPMVNEGHMWMMSKASTRALELDAAAQGWALATVGPDGGSVTSTRAQLRHADGDIETIVHFNRVSANYFSVLGVRVQLACGPLADWPQDGVLVNRQFLAMHALDDDLTWTLVPENSEPLRPCGIVDDAQVLDARAGLAPMVYRPLQERRDLGVAIATEYGPQPRAEMDRLLKQHFPDTTAGPAQSVRERLDEQLSQERHMVRLNLVVMLIASAISSAAVLMLGAAALRRQARTLATRRALGASRGHLIVAALLGRSRRVRWAMAAVAAAASALALHLLAATPAESIPVLAWAALGMLLWAAALAGSLLRQLDEQQLMATLKA